MYLYLNYKPCLKFIYILTRFFVIYSLLYIKLCIYDELYRVSTKSFPDYKYLLQEN